MNIRLITTSYINNIKETKIESMQFNNNDAGEMKVVNIYPDIEYQEFEGFGGALTDASGYVYSCMSEENRKKIIDSYFGEEGNCYTLARTHIDSCDFSVEMYQAVNNADDTEFESFSVKRNDKYIIPLLDAANAKANKPLKIMFSPWSPPDFMKTTGERKKGGSLKKECRQAWAKYICKYINEYRGRGYNVDRITIQNEPLAVQTWDSCVYSSEEEKVFLRDFLYPELIASGLQDIEVNIWDHNKERMFERACDIIDDETDKMVQGIAFHWYSGDHFEAISLVREKFPDKKITFTEGCVEYYKFGENASQLANAQMYAHDIIGNINAGMNAFIDWNIILDEKGGPNHVGNFCDAPIMCNIVEDKIEKRLSFHYIGHFSKYIKPGAKRIAFTKYTDKLDITTLKNIDGSIICVLMNRTNEDINVMIRVKGESVKLNIPANTISTGIIK